MTHVAHIVDAGHSKHMRLIISEVGIGLDGCGDVLETGAVLQLHIDHAAMNALSKWNGHRQSILHTLLRTYTYRVTHRHAGAEVRVAQALRGETLHERAHDTVAARVPTGGNNSHGTRLLADLHESLAIAANVGMNVERVDGIDAQRQDLLGIFLTRTGGRGKDGHIYVLQLANVAHHLIWSELQRLILGTLPAHDTSDFKIFCSFQCLHREASDVAVAYYGGSNFLHVSDSFVGLLICHAKVQK